MLSSKNHGIGIFWLQANRVHNFFALTCSFDILSTYLDLN
jgi:hypothetical protein